MPIAVFFKRGYRSQYKLKKKKKSPQSHPNPAVHALTQSATPKPYSPIHPSLPPILLIGADEAEASITGLLLRSFPLSLTLNLT